MLSKGQKINDRYEILKSIGEGGMANVYLAHDTILDRDVAVKVLRGDLENDEKFIRRFNREAKSVSDLTSPNIVEVYDVGEEDGQHYIVMEYIDGKTLKQLIQKRGALTVPEVIDIMSQITDGLAQAHDAYIIHRDIKPQNIMILDNGIIKITDFGIAMSMNATQLTQTNSVMGSVHYLPPEQASGKGATTKSDIYSAGILMYELLTGSVPFKGDNAVEIALKQLKEKIPSIRKQNPLIPQSVENIVLKATAKNPKNRYDDIREMHYDLVHALDSENENVSKYNFPYPESELDESRAIPIKDTPVIPKREVNMELPKEDDLDKSINSKKDNKMSIAVLVGVSLLVIMVALLLFFNNRNKYKTVEVPDVVGFSVKKAESTLKNKGFKYDIKEEASDEVKEGYVIKTSPKAGSSKKKGSIITIYESSGQAEIDLENYVNQELDSVKANLNKLGLSVKVEKKEVSNPKDYVGKDKIIIAQSPEYDENEKKVLHSGDVITLYTPDILNEYPDMSLESWTLSKVEEFTTKYGLTLKVKDSKGNSISDYSSYMDSVVIKQSRTGEIASGVTFTVTIDADTTSYTLTINYYNKKKNTPVGDTKTESHKNGDSGNVICPEFTGYTKVTPSVSYKIEGKDLAVSCYYEEVSSSNNSSDNSNE